MMPYAFGDYILTCGEITCQSFGLDRKKTVRKRSFFMSLRYEKDIFEKYLKNPNHPLLITIKKPPLNGSTLYVGISTVNDNAAEAGI